MLPKQGVTPELARFIVDTKWDDLPGTARHEAKRALMNFFAVAIAGCRTQPVELALRTLGEFSGGRHATIVGRPERIEDLRAHRIICQQPGAAQVSAGAELVQRVLAHEVASTLRINNYFGVLQGVMNHLGVGILPEYLAQDFPDLELVLEDVHSVEVPVFLAYPEELRHSKRVAAFRDFVMEQVAHQRRGARG